MKPIYMLLTTKLYRYATETALRFVSPDFEGCEKERQRLIDAGEVCIEDFRIVTLSAYGPQNLLVGESYHETPLW